MTDTTTNAPALSPNVDDVAEQRALASGDGITEAQYRELVLDSLGRGIIGRAEADDELRAIGAPPVSDTETTAPAAPLVAAPARPSAEPGAILAGDYKLPDINALHELIASRDGVEAAPLSSAELVREATTIRGWLAAGGFPPDVGSSLANVAASHIRQVPHWDQMEPGAQEAFKVGQMALLQKTWGKDTAANIDIARKMIADIESKSPGLSDFLINSGLGNSAALIVQVAHQAQRVRAG